MPAHYATHSMIGWALAMSLLTACAAGGWAAAPEAAADNPYGTWWRGGKGAADVRKACPSVKGVFAVFAWSELEPRPGEFDWPRIDAELAEYAAADLSMQLMVWAGPHCPRWLYEQGVPEVQTTPTINPHGKPHGWTYPFYLDEDYKRFYHRMIREFAAHIDTLPPDVRRRILCIQTAEGTTGDEGGYKGNPLDPKYALPEKQWVEFKLEAWRLFDELYRPKQPRIHLLINSGNQGQYHDWLMKNMPDTWRKAGNPGHGYQLNGEVEMLAFLDPIINHPDERGEVVRCRSEMDEIHKGWFAEAPVWNQYWLNLWNLHFGIDILQHVTDALVDPRHQEGFAFYSLYGGHKDPASSPGAWCALRDGLDAADRQRFPDDAFGKGTFSNRKPEIDLGIARCLAIAKAFEARGARQGDAEKAMFSVMKNRDASAMNDVGWGVWPGNYERYLTQIDPAGTSLGWWRVGPKDQPYGRFARGTNTAAGHDALRFQLHERFFANDPAGQPRQVSVRVVWFDRGDAKWSLTYDAIDGAEKTAFEVANGDSGRWLEKTVELNDARFERRGPGGADLSLVRSGGGDLIAHLIEIRRR